MKRKDAAALGLAAAVLVVLAAGLAVVLRLSSALTDIEERLAALERRTAEVSSRAESERAEAGGVAGEFTRRLGALEERLEDLHAPTRAAAANARRPRASVGNHPVLGKYLVEILKKRTEATFAVTRQKRARNIDDDEMQRRMTRISRLHLAAERELREMLLLLEERGRPAEEVEKRARFLAARTTRAFEAAAKGEREPRDDGGRVRPRRFPPRPGGGPRTAPGEDQVF